MPYKINIKGDPKALKSREFQCGLCGHQDVYLLSSADDTPECCGHEMFFVYSWVGGDDGLSGGFFFSNSMQKDFSSEKAMKEYVLSQRRHKPGETIYKKDGSRTEAAPLYNESAEKVHGARNESHLEFGKRLYSHKKGS